jgi:hypothetical protein
VGVLLMGSIVEFWPPSEWEIEMTLPNHYRVQIGEIEDWYIQPCVITMLKDVYNKCVSGEYTVRRKGRSLLILEGDTVVKTI